MVCDYMKMQLSGKPYPRTCPECKLGPCKHSQPVTTAPTKPTIDECSKDPEAPHGFDRNASHSEGRYVCECEHHEAHKAIMEAKRPEPVAYWDGSSRIIVTQKERDWDARTGGILAYGRDKPLYGPDLLAYADRMAADAHHYRQKSDMLSDAAFQSEERAETAERQLARETARADSWVKEVRDVARELGIADEDSNGSIHDWRHIKYKLRQLAELQRKHDALVKRLREPVDEYLNISDLWKKSEDDAEGMDLGHPTQAHYFAALLQQAMSAVALDKGGE